MALDFIIPTDSTSRDQIISDILSTATSSVGSQVRDDRILAFTIQPVVASTGRTPWLPDWANTDTFQLAIGLADQVPTSGTFKLTVNVTTTNLLTLAYNISAAALQTPLSAAFVAEGHSACTVTLLATGVYRVLATSNGAVSTGILVGDPTNLNPPSSVFINEDSLGSASAPYDFLIVLRQAPMCYATATTNLPATGVSVATTQAGDSTHNQIQTISFTVTPTFEGTFSVSLVAGYQVPITGNTVANPTVVTTGEAHGFISGQTISIPVNNGSSPTIAGSRVVTVIDSTSFSIPVNVTTAGTTGSCELDVTASCGVAWPTMSADEFALVLANHSAVRFNSTTGNPNNIVVTKSGQNFQVQFTGTLGNSATPTLTCTNIDLIGAEGASGTLNLNTLGLYEYSLTQSAETFTLLLSITRTRASGEVRTILGPTEISISKDLIDLSTMVPTPLPSYYTAAYIDAHFAAFAGTNAFTGANTFTTSGGVPFTVDGTGNATFSNTGVCAFIGTTVSLSPTGNVQLSPAGTLTVTNVTAFNIDSTFTTTFAGHTTVNALLDGTWQTFTRGTGTVTVATTGFVNITGLSASIGASETWVYHVKIPITGATNGCKFQVTGPASPTAVQIDVDSPIASAANISRESMTAFSSPTSSAYLSAAFTSWADLWITVVNGVNAGTVQVQFATAAGTNTITALASRTIEGYRKA